MRYLIKNASITIKGNTILDSINLEINDNNHIGIVGKNGAGKTTLLKSLIDNNMLEEGIDEEKFEIQKIGSFSIGYQEQITFENENITLLEEIQKSYKEIINLEKKIDKLSKLLEKDNSNENILEYTETLEKFKYLGGYTYKKEYEVMLSKFGFKEEDKSKTISSFSGGERTKIAFIKLLLSKPDLLLLDEPTNHLDVETIIWLEEYLKNYKGSFVIVSHDRMFLNNTVNIIYDISNKEVIKYVGNYEQYEKIKKQNYEKALKDYEKQKKEIEKLKTIYEKFRYKPTKASMALSRLHMLEKMEILDKPNKIDDKTFRTNLDKIVESSKVVLNIRDLKVGYNKELCNINLEVIRGKKIGIIGANGTGKSTLLKTLNGIIKPISGHITYGYNVKIGYFDQNLAMIDSNNTVLEEFSLAHPEVLENDARKILGSFLFRGLDVYKKVNVLSGGEKVRLSLCKILYDKPNLLILDEPTNHMDIVGKQHLEDILDKYKGTIIFVSHDRYFVKKIATDLIVFEDENAKYYQYGYEEYLSKKIETKKEEKVIVKTKKEIVKKSSFYEEKKEFKKIEQEIIKLEEEKIKLNNEISNNFNDYKKTNEIQNEINKIEDKLIELNKRWEELIEIIID